MSSNVVFYLLSKSESVQKICHDEINSLHDAMYNKNFNFNQSPVLSYARAFFSKSTTVPSLTLVSGKNLNQALEFVSSEKQNKIAQLLIDIDALSFEERLHNSFRSYFSPTTIFRPKFSNTVLFERALHGKPESIDSYFRRFFYFNRFDFLNSLRSNLSTYFTYAPPLLH